MKELVYYTVSGIENYIGANKNILFSAGWRDIEISCLRNPEKTRFCKMKFVERRFTVVNGVVYYKSSGGSVDKEYYILKTWRKDMWMPCRGVDPERIGKMSDRIEEKEKLIDSLKQLIDSSVKKIDEQELNECLEYMKIDSEHDITRNDILYEKGLLGQLLRFGSIETMCVSMLLDPVPWERNILLQTIKNEVLEKCKNEPYAKINVDMYIDKENDSSSFESYKSRYIKFDEKRNTATVMINEYTEDFNKKLLSMGADPIKMDKLVGASLSDMIQDKIRSVENDIESRTPDMDFELRANQIRSAVNAIIDDYPFLPVELHLKSELKSAVNKHITSTFVSRIYKRGGQDGSTTQEIWNIICQLIKLAFDEAVKTNFSRERAISNILNKFDNTRLGPKV